jgi:hypothetical protein
MNSAAAKQIEQAIITYFDKNLLYMLKTSFNLIIAGGFIHDVLNHIEPTDIDIFVFRINEFKELIQFFTRREEYQLCFYTSIIEVKSHKFSKTIQLINSIGKDEWEIMDDFDFDHNRVFYIPNKGEVFASINCLKCWKTKKINRPYGYNTYITKLRFKRAMEKGYQFTSQFIQQTFNVSLDEQQITPDKIMELVASDDYIADSRKLTDSDIILITRDTKEALHMFETQTAKKPLNMTLRI